MTDDKATFDGWAILELLGHRRLGGYVREQQIAGAGMLRIDVPGPDGSIAATQLYPPSALYCLTPTTEEMARAVARSSRVEPVQRWELPKLPAPTFEAGTCDACGTERYDLQGGYCGSCRVTLTGKRPIDPRDGDDYDDGASRDYDYDAEYPDAARQ